MFDTRSGYLCKTDALHKPSPLGRGDRSGASFGKVRARTREAIAVGEIRPAVALSPKRITDTTH